MDIVKAPFDLYEISFPAQAFDKVHAEALCVLLRQNTAMVGLASHAMDQSRLVMKIRLVKGACDDTEDTVRRLLEEAVQVRVEELETLLHCIC